MMDFKKYWKVRAGLRTCIDSIFLDCYDTCPYYAECHESKTRVLIPLLKDALVMIEALKEERDCLRDEITETEMRQRHNAVAGEENWQDRLKRLEFERVTKVLNFEDAKGASRYGACVVIEQSSRACENFLCRKNTKNYIKLVRASESEFALQWAAYGHSWRMWSAFPTWEQREAVAWG